MAAPSLAALAELNLHLSGGSRVIMISEKEVDLRPQAPDNRLFLLKMAEGSLAAGGRGGGFGERKVVKALAFVSSGGQWSKLYESEDESRAAEFEIPYYVSRLPYTLSDGSESVGYGVVESELVGQMFAKAGLL
jgi:hypothetical protein